MSEDSVCLFIFLIGGKES